MTDQEILKLQKRARYVAVKWGQAELADDIAQEVVLSLIRWPGQTVEQAVSGFLRKEQGDPRTHCGRIRKASRFRDIRLDAPTDREEAGGTLNHELIGSPPGDPDPSRESRGCPDKLTGLQKLIYELRFEEEWPIKEIADYLDMAPQTVQQYLVPIHRALRYAGALEELEAKLIEDPKYFEVEVDWIRW